MLSVPSLVGTGTVVAAATAGLVFGQPTESNPSRPASNKRKLTSDYDNPRVPLPASPLVVSPTAPSLANDRPGSDVFVQPSPQSMGPSSASTSRPPRSSLTQTTPPKASSRRHSFIRQNEWVPPPISEVSRDSVSSNGSWMRRLSIRPLSQHGSPRSSVLVDSPSLTFSHASAQPFLPPSSATPPQQARNKLVKRTTAAQDGSNGVPLTRKASRSQMPTLRRPATSHQRSATLQQFQPPTNAAGAPAPLPKYSLDQQIRPDAAPMQVDLPEPNREQATKWSSFFHSRISKAPSRATSSRPSEGSPSNYQLPHRRLHLRQGSVPRAYLIIATMMAEPTATSVQPSSAARTPAGAAGSPAPQGPEAVGNSPDGTPSKRARRSISMHFSSPSNWMSRSGSLRRPKRGSDSKAEGTRHVSAPVAAPQGGGRGDIRRAVEDIFAPPHLRRDAASKSTGNGENRTRQRNSSSPLPPLSRLSSFNVDLSRLGASGASGPKSASAASGGVFPPHQGFAFPQHSRDVSNERASTLTGSDLEMRGFISGDDDDTDFKSDTMFDSIRTTGSARLRSVETPLESMFDESPPSTAGNPKTKRLSIQEILGRSWDGDTKIMEEDEGVPTPVRGGRSSHGNVEFADANDDLHEVLGYGLPPAVMPFAQRDFGRLSLDDDDDDDWARLDENGVTNNLSPPSGSVNSRGVSPNMRKALASISGNGSPESFHHDPTERPRSNVFDWSEPTSMEKSEVDGQSPRPKTAHGKQDLDSRGGRPSNRKGPTAAHVRSQSVPVIADLPENKSASKFGTWASGPKNAAEDWDDDFDFGASGPSVSHGKQPAKTLSMIVPASIQATQPSVKAHSGQIRELSLLVNGLKRLCRHGRDLDILDESPALWKEAENIIALASPDEDNDEAEEGRGSTEFDPADVDERYLDEGFDASTLNSLEDPFEAQDSSRPAATAAAPDRQPGRRRSVFSPEDDIFGGSWPLSNNVTKPDVVKPERPRTPDRSRAGDAPDTAMIASIMEAMQKQRSSSVPLQASPVRPSKSELFFNTNTLQELVKAANTLFHNLSEIVRRAELITQSPACTPRHERIRRPEVSPAFTRVFTDPSSPPKRLPKSHSTNSVLSRNSGDTPRTGGMGQRMQMMTVS